jgi:predicted DsbA family dithiol-disulfide isomerase
MQAYELDFEWRGFELHPEIPVGGADLTQMFRSDKVEQMRIQLEVVASELGVPLAFPDRSNNTRAALAIAEHARDRGCLKVFRDAAMDAFWRDGRDLEDPEVLSELATAAGLVPSEALAAREDPVLVARVRAMGTEAARWGVSGIPTWFVLPDGWEPGDPRPADGRRPVRVVGCQPYAQVEAAARAAGAVPRAGNRGTS